MDYTLSNAYTTDAGTGNRMHQQSAAIPTAVTDADMNSVIWSLMEIVKAAGLAGAQFDKATPATYQKLLTALRSAGVFTTPAQFDATTKAATTAFIKAVGLNFGGIDSITVATNLAANAAGRLQYFAGAASYTVTLPPAASFPPGASIPMMCVATLPIALTRAGADTIQLDSNTVTSLVMTAGSVLTLVSNGVGLWVAIGAKNMNAGASASVIRTAAASVPNGVFTAPIWDSVEFDPFGLWNSGSNAFVAKWAGVYRVSAMVYINPNLTPSNAYVEVWVNGVSTRRLNEFTTNSGSTNSPLDAATASPLIKLNIGDSVKIYLMLTVSSTASLAAPSADGRYNYFQLQFVG